MNLRKQLARIFLRPEYDRATALIQSAVNDWRMVPYLQAREGDANALIAQLGEVDSRLVDFITRQLRDYSADTTETFRLQIVRECRSLYLNDPMTQFAVELWTDYAFGESPSLTAVDAGAQEVWDEFWQADRNTPVLGERNLHKRSVDELCDGELFFAVFASELDGESTIRMLPTEQIKETVKDPEDSSVVLYYRRDYFGADGQGETVYYKDWHATDEQLARAKLPSDAKVAHTLKPGTDVVILHAGFRVVNGRGWPLATASVDWTREYRQFLQNRAAVARAAATFVEKIKAKGGQRAIDAIKARIGTSLAGAADTFETNPPPAAGSAWIENDAMSREWMNRPTNSGDAEKDGAAIKRQAALGYKLYPHFLGDGDYYRLATTTAMEGPTLKSFNRYQAFWASVWKDLFKIILIFMEKYGNRTFTSHEAKLSIDRIITLAQEDITAAMNTLTGIYDRGLIDAPAAQAISLTLLKTSLEMMGIQGVDEMLKLVRAPIEPNADPAAAMEAGERQSFFQEDVGDYGVAIRRIFYALWSGKSDKDWFRDNMQYMVDRGLRRAWKEGMESVGLTMDDMTDEEEADLGAIILDQYGYIDGAADFVIANSKANDGKLADIQPRAQMWVNRYNQVLGKARMSAASNPLLTWTEGPTKEKCADCIYANGRTYRASVWKKWGWETQSSRLACNGFKCQCSLDPAPPGSKANKGHPRRPSG